MQSLTGVVSTIRDLKAGMCITLVDKGITRSEHTDTTWITDDVKGRTSFFEVTKAGQKYIHGFGHYYDPETKELKEASYESKYLFTDYVVISGFNTVAKERYKKYQADTRAYEELKTKAEREIDYKINTMKTKMLDDWSSKNPRPKALEI